MHPWNNSVELHVYFIFYSLLYDHVSCIVAFVHTHRTLHPIASLCTSPQDFASVALGARSVTLSQNIWTKCIRMTFGNKLRHIHQQESLEHTKHMDTDIGYISNKNNSSFKSTSDSILRGSSKLRHSSSLFKKTPPASN